MRFNESNFKRRLSVLSAIVATAAFPIRSSALDIAVPVSENFLVNHLSADGKMYSYCMSVASATLNAMNYLSWAASGATNACEPYAIGPYDDDGNAIWWDCDWCFDALTLDEQAIPLFGKKLFVEIATKIPQYVNARDSGTPDGLHFLGMAGSCGLKKSGDMDIVAVKDCAGVTGGTFYPTVRPLSSSPLNAFICDYASLVWFDEEDEGRVPTAIGEWRFAEDLTEKLDRYGNGGQGMNTIDALRGMMMGKGRLFWMIHYAPFAALQYCAPIMWFAWVGHTGLTYVEKVYEHKSEARYVIEIDSDVTEVTFKDLEIENSSDTETNFVEVAASDMFNVKLSDGWGGDPHLTVFDVVSTFPNFPWQDKPGSWSEVPGSGGIYRAKCKWTPLELEQGAICTVTCTKNYLTEWTEGTNVAVIGNNRFSGNYGNRLHYLGFWYIDTRNDWYYDGNSIKTTNPGTSISPGRKVFSWNDVYEHVGMQWKEDITTPQEPTPMWINKFPHDSAPIHLEANPWYFDILWDGDPKDQGSIIGYTTNGVDYVAGTEYVPVYVESSPEMSQDTEDFISYDQEVEIRDVIFAVTCPYRSEFIKVPYTMKEE